MYIEIIVTKILTNICLEYELTKLKFKCKSLNNQTASKLLELMPFKSTVSKWGKELYFDVPKNDIREEKSAKVLFNLGEIAFWNEGNAIAIGYGKTPTSINDEIRLVSSGNLWAIACNPEELYKLDDFDPEDQIVIRKLVK